MELSGRVARASGSSPGTADTYCILIPVYAPADASISAHATCRLKKYLSASSAFLSLFSEFDKRGKNQRKVEVESVCSF